MGGKPLSGLNDAPRRSRRADARKKKRHGGKRARFSRPQRLTLLAALCGVVVCLAFFLVSSARLADQTRLMEEEQEAYERRVWRTTVRYRDQIIREAQKYGLRPAYIAAIILNESSYEPSAVSSVGARGLMQLLPDTGKWIAGKLGMSDYTEDRLFDAETNLRLGTWYLNFLSDRYGGDPVLVACAYHAGHGNVDTWLTRYSKDGRTLSLAEIPMENTRSYARKVVDSYAIYLENYYQD